MRFLILVFIVLFLLSTRFWSILPLVFASDLSVSATVPADTNDFQLEITSSGTSPLKAQTIYSYTITYGSYLANATNFAIVASWSEGTLEGSDTQITAVEYVLGSASNGENNTTPIIDLTHKTITWEFDSFPAQTTDKILTFQLKTRSFSSKNQKINFVVSTDLTGPGVTINKTLSQYLLTESASDNTAEVTSTPTPTHIIATTTPAESLQKQALYFEVIDIRKLTANEAIIFIKTNKPSRINVAYGKDRSFFEHIVYKNTYETSHLITLPNLDQQTHYYLKITIADDKNHLQSETYAFVTPRKIELATVQRNTVYVISNNIIFNTFALSNFQTNTKGKLDEPTIVLPFGTPYTLQASLTNNEQIKKVEIFVRNDSVLGIFSFEKTHALSNRSAASTSHAEILHLLSHNRYFATLTVPTTKGKYSIFLRITDMYGNITEEKIGEIIASPPIRVFSSRDQKGVEGARAVLALYDEKKKRYTLTTPSTMPILNPSYSNYRGEISLVLPEGKYQLTVTHPAYFGKTIQFTIPNKSLEYPHVTLDKKPFAISVLASLHRETIQRMLVEPLQRYTAFLLFSERMSDLTKSVSVGLFLFLSIFSFAKRIQLSPMYLPFYIVRVLHSKRRHNNFTLNLLKGRIIAVDNKKGLSHVNIYLFDTKKRIRNHAVSNSSGFFVLKNIPDGEYTLAFLKEGYEAVYLSTKIPHSTSLVHINLTKKAPAKTKIERMKRTFSYVASFIFEIVILSIFLFMILIGLQWGLQNSVPYLLLNSINLGLWILYKKNKTQEDTV